MTAGWATAKLGDICHKVTDGSHNPPKGIDASDYIMLSSKNVFDDKITLEKPRFLSQSDFEAENRRTEVSCGDILLTIVGTVGRAAVVPESLPPITLQRSVAVLKPDTSAIIPRFLMFALHSILDELLEGARGVAQKGIYLKSLREVEIPLPPLEEQKRIVAILDEAFEGLDRARAHTEANLQNAQELFDGYLQDLFTHPDPTWTMQALGDYCEQITVGHVGPMADRYTDSGTVFLRSQNIKPFRVDLTNVKFIDEKFTEELKKSELRPGDVAIVRTGYPGTCAVIPEDLPIANCADLVIARPGPDLDPNFLAVLLNSAFGKQLVAGAAVGAAQKHFNVSAARKAVFPFPPLEVQRRLVEKSNEIAAATTSLAEKIEVKRVSIEELRQSLLAKAFSGELTATEFA